MYRVRFVQPVDVRLGRHVNHDPRSRAFPVRGDQPIVSVQHERHIPIFDQGRLGSCTGNAAVGCTGTGLFYESIRQAMPAPFFSFDESGAVKCYSRATAIDGYAGTFPPDDTGSDGLSVAKALQQAGEIAGYEHAFSLEQGLRGLMTRPGIVGVPWKDDMFNPDAEGIVHPTGALAGGHEFVWDGYNQVRGLCWFTNSWGPQWGKAGRFAIPAEEFAGLLDQDGDITFFTPIDAPAPAPVPVPSSADAADRVLWEAADVWSVARHVGGNAAAARAVKAWASAKGLL